MDPVLAGITLGTFVKDLIELARYIKESIDKVGENKAQLSKLRDEVTGTLYGLAGLTEQYNDAKPSRELLTAFEDLKSHLESIHKKCAKGSQRTSRFRLKSWGKSWWNRQEIDQEIKQLNELKKDCYAKFTLFCAARTEGKADQIVDTTTQIRGAAVQITSTTARIEAAGVHIADTTTRIEAETGQIASTAAQIEDQTVLLADTTAQIQTGIVQVASTTARIEDGTVLLTDTTARIEQTTDQVQILALEQKLERWLEYPPNMKKRQDDTQGLQHEGTGSWFLGGDQYKDWKKIPGSLWIRGESGTGKSVLSSTVIRELFSERQPKTAVAYFYFDFRDEKSQRVKMMLQSIILQLSAQSPNPYSVLDRLYKSSQGQILPTHESLLGILDELLSDLAHTYIVLDALDECNKHDHLVQFVTRLRDWTTGALHLLFTSQPRQIFVEAFKHASLVTLTPNNTQTDIQRFIDSKLHQLSHLTRRMRAEEIAAKVVEKSNGMFRLADLLLTELGDAFDPDLDAILSSLPDSLFGVYSRFLKRIHPTAIFYVSTVLHWLVFSSTMLTMGCLEDALAFDFSDPSKFVYDRTRRGENADRVCKMLEGMIAVGRTSWRENTKVVTLAHASVEDYFRSENFTHEYPVYDLRAGPSHRFLAQTCLGYLLQFTDHHFNYKTRFSHPLETYMGANWYYHMHRSDDPARLSPLVVSLLQDGRSQYAAFSLRTDSWGMRCPHPLNECSEVGYTEAVRLLLQSGADPNTKDNGSTALQLASASGHLDIVHILLESGAEVDVVALDEARTHSRWNIVQVLLQKGSISEGGISVAHEWINHQLVIAVQDDSLEIVRILLKAWINLGGAQVLLHYLLVVASKRDQLDIVRLLLNHGADVNAATTGYNALCAASFYNNVDTVRILLEKGADVNATSGRYGNALQTASHRGSIESVRLLIEHGAEVNSAGGRYGNALQAASFGDNLEIVRLLLENGADVNAAGGEYGSALQAASIRGHAAFVRLLIEHGADVNATGGVHGSALQAASRIGDVDTVRLLLEKGADVQANGRSALDAAARLGRSHISNWWKAEQITRILLEHGAHEENMTAHAPKGVP